MFDPSEGHKKILNTRNVVKVPDIPSFGVKRTAKEYHRLENKGLNAEDGTAYEK